LTRAYIFYTSDYDNSRFFVGEGGGGGGGGGGNIVATLTLKDIPLTGTHKDGTVTAKASKSGITSEVGKGTIANNVLNITISIPDSVLGPVETNLSPGTEFVNVEPEGTKAVSFDITDDADDSSISISTSGGIDIRAGVVLAYVDKACLFYNDGYQYTLSQPGFLGWVYMMSTSTIYITDDGILSGSGDPKWY